MGDKHLAGQRHARPPRPGQIHRGSGREQPPEGAQPVTPDSPIEVVRSAYRIVRSEQFYTLDERGVITTQTGLIGIRARRADARYVVMIQAYAEDPRRGVLSVEAGPDCRIARLTEHDTGVIEVVLELNQPAQPDDPDVTTASYILHYHSDRRTDLLQFSNREPLDYHALRVQFSAAAAPASIWGFRGKFPETATTTGVQPLALNPAHFYHRDFSGPSNEYWGIAWKWDV